VHLSRALKLCRRNGVPTLLWGHGFSKGESSWKRRVRNRLLDSAAAVLLYNQHAADRLVQEGIHPSRTFVAHNAIDQTPIRAAREHWLARPDDLARFRAEHGIASEDMALFISRLERDKRIDLLLDAFAIVAQRRPAARLAIIGRGREEAPLRAHAARLGLAQHVLFTGSVYDDMHLAPWFLSAACMAYPVAIGLSILHAFGYGVPVVTSDDIASHNPEIESLRAGQNGLLYRDGDAGDFAAKILTCMDDSPLRSRMADAATETVREPDGFCLQRMVRGFTDAIAFATQASTRQSAGVST
jgi:glycosyltransferase involved in cell wall biosynthesis